jgi:two-component system, OmpR family, heavy metal sensor histidine kinase CusS
MTVSLRTRLLSGITISIALLLGVFSLILYAVTRHNMIQHFDDSLLSTAKLLSAVVEEEGPDTGDEGREHHDANDDPNEPDTGIEFEFDVRMTPAFNQPNGGAYYQFWNHDQSVVIRSPSLGQRDLPYFGQTSDTPVCQPCVLPDNGPGRVIGYRFIPRSREAHPAQGSPFVLVLGRDASDLQAFLRSFQCLLLACSALVVCLSIGVTFTVTRRGLHPVHVLAQEIQSIDEQILEQSFASDAYPIELLPICECLHGLMDRIKESFKRERRFNADIAHELRTPLAGIQSTLEVCLSRPREALEYQRALKGCLAITESMSRMVGILLKLSRLDAQQVSLAVQRIGLKHLIDGHWPSFTGQAMARGIVFENHINEDVACASDRDHLDMIVSNILENAVQYCDEGGRVWVRAESSGDSIRLFLSNTGCDLSPEDAGRVFDFFWRQDKSRTDVGQHLGIGLSVVQKVARALGMRVEVVIDPAGIFTVQLDFFQHAAEC